MTSTDELKARRAKLSRAWTLMADAVLRSLEADSPSASALEVGRKFLADNGATIDAIRDWRGSLGVDPASLPTFDDSDEDGDSSMPSALRTVPGFVE